MHILITGGTGFVGTAFVKYVLKLGHRVTIVTTSSNPIAEVPYAEMPAFGELLESSILESVDIIVNMAGTNISSGRWTKKRKQSILESRIRVTGMLVNSLARNKKEQLRYPKVLINTSAVGYYGTHDEQIFDEDSPVGDGFLASVASQWEDSAKKVLDLEVRLVILRFGIVFASGGGMLEQMKRPFDYGVGGMIGSGGQWISWIHREDLIRLIEEAATDNRYQGIFNACSPNPVTMKQLTNAMAKSLGRLSWTWMPGFAARMIFGEMAKELLLHGQKVEPRRLKEVGFVFQYRGIDEALGEIYGVGSKL